MRNHPLMACPTCDLLHRRSALAAGQVARCIRCGTMLYRTRAGAGNIDRPLAFTLAGAVLFIIANAAPFLTLSMEGRFQETLLISGVRTLFHEGQPGLGTLILFTGIVLPFIQLVSLIYVFLSVKSGRPGRRVAVVFRWIRHLQPWAMAEVFLLAILVSAAKLTHTADMVPGAALYAFMVMIFSTAAAWATLNVHDIWRRLPVQPGHWEPCETPRSSRAAVMVGCPICGLVSSPSSEAVASSGKRNLCPRCGGALNRRIPQSLSRTWALLIAAFVCYLPANLLPVTITTSLGYRQTDTIMSGVIYFLTSGAWYLAMIIFIASILVPLIKLAVLFFLLVSVQKKTAWRRQERSRMYHIIERIGRWSMLDIFVVAVLVALVRMQTLASIDAGPGAVFFGIVVVITMLAAQTFDPRLIWDSVERSE